MPDASTIFYLLAIFSAGTFVGIAAMFVAAAAGHLRILGRLGHLQLVAQARRIERELVARELHDTLLQSNHILSLNIQILAQRLPWDDPMQSRIAHAQVMAEELAKEGRQCLMNHCDSNEDKRFVDQLDARGRAIAASGEVKFATKCSGAPLTLCSLVDHELARIVGEALMNAFRHAQAKTIELHVQFFTNALMIAVEDDGCGMPENIATSRSPEHLGIVMMKARAKDIGATLRFTASMLGGTRVELRLPAILASFGDRVGPSLARQSA